MVQNGSYGPIRCVFYDIDGSRHYGILKIEFGRSIDIKPVVDSFAEGLAKTLSTEVRIARFTPNNRQSGGDFATHHLEAEGKPDLEATVQSWGKTSDWAYIGLRASNGLNPRGLLTQYADEYLVPANPSNGKH